MGRRQPLPSPDPVRPRLSRRERAAGRATGAAVAAALGPGERGPEARSRATPRGGGEGPGRGRPEVWAEGGGPGRRRWPNVRDPDFAGRGLGRPGARRWGPSCGFLLLLVLRPGRGRPDGRPSPVLLSAPSRDDFHASAAWRGRGAHLGGAGVGVELGEPLVRAVLQRGEEHLMAPHAAGAPRPAPRPPRRWWWGLLPQRESGEGPPPPPRPAWQLVMMGPPSRGSWVPRWSSLRTTSATTASASPVRPLSPRTELVFSQRFACREGEV